MWIWWRRGGRSLERIGSVWGSHSSTLYTSISHFSSLLRPLHPSHPKSRSPSQPSTTYNNVKTYLLHGHAILTGRTSRRATRTERSSHDLPHNTPTQTPRKNPGWILSNHEHGRVNGTHSGIPHQRRPFFIFRAREKHVRRMRGC